MQSSNGGPHHQRVAPIIIRTPPTSPISHPRKPCSSWAPNKRIPQEMLLKKTCGLQKNKNILEHIVTELNEHCNQNMYAKVLNFSLCSILQTYLNSCLLFACSISVCPWVVLQSTSNITWTYFNRLLLNPSFECNRNWIKLKGRSGWAGFCYRHLVSHTLVGGFNPSEKY